MTAEKIQCDYDALEGVASMFDQSHGTVQSMLASLISAKDALLPEGFEGEAATAFDEEMEELVLPRVRRLLDALELAANDMRRIAELLAQAEDDAAQCFRRSQFV